jgi:hypothetical protein
VEARPSRIEAARQRAAGAKQTAVAVAVAGFLVIALLARASHPGHARSASSGSGSDPSTQSDDDGGFSLTPGSIAPSSGSTGGGAQTNVS